MSALWKLTLVEAKLFVREPFAAFFTLAFPLGYGHLLSNAPSFRSGPSE